MKPQRFATAIFIGKLIQFLVCALITIFFGPAIAHAVRHTMHEHLSVVLVVVGVLALTLVVYVLRKLFDRRRGTRFPLEETTEPDAAVADPDDSTLIT
jgi:membrane protein DedA with SNARE-associated domain